MGNRSVLFLVGLLREAFVPVSEACCLVGEVASGATRWEAAWREKEDCEKRSLMSLCNGEGARGRELTTAKGKDLISITCEPHSSCLRTDELAPFGMSRREREEALGAQVLGFLLLLSLELPHFLRPRSSPKLPPPSQRPLGAPDHIDKPFRPH